MLQRVSIVGWHNAGKTTVAEALVRELKRRGARVAVIKHSREGFSMDHPGTDTWRMAEAGSDVVAIASREAVAWIERLPAEASLEDLIARLPADIDVLLVEGFKNAPGPKVEVIRQATGVEPVARGGDLVAIVSDDVRDPRPVPTFAFGDAAGLLAYLDVRVWGR